MNRRFFTVMLIVLCVPVVAVVAQSAEERAGQSIPKLASRVGGAMARLEFVIDSRIVSPIRRSGQCVCIDASKRLFLTRDVPGGIPTGELRDFVLVTPGVGGKRINAEFVGRDSETGLSFIRASAGHKFSEVRFARASNLRLGQRVISAGLLGSHTGNALYLGTGMVSSVIRFPQQLVYVSGGELTNSSSPVFTDTGLAVGIVAGQPSVEHRLMLSGRWTNVGLAGVQAGKFFLPVEEFIGVLSEPVGARKLPWTGIVKFHAVGPEQSGTIKNLGGAPATLIGQVLPDSPATMAGVKQADVIVAFEGVPLEKLPTPEFTVAEFTRRLLRCKVGQKVSLTLLRNGERKTAQLTLAVIPKRPYEAAHCYNKALGVAGRDMVMWDRYVGRDKPLLEKGVIVTMVRRNSLAAKSGLRPGDLITTVDDRAVPSAEALGGTLDALTRGGSIKPINFIVRRGDQPESLTIKP